MTGRWRIANDPHATSLRPETHAIINKVEAGQDLDPHLFSKVRKHDYVMIDDPDLADGAVRDYRDFLLNVMGLHHFHSLAHPVVQHFL